MFSFVKAFFAGLAAMLVFNQGALWLIDQTQWAHPEYWNMAPLWVPGFPVIAWLAIWGGLWGIVSWGLIRQAEAAGYYVGSVLMSGVLMTVVALLIALKVARPVFGVDLNDYAYDTIGVVLAANAAYGLGLAIFMRILHPYR